MKFPDSERALMEVVGQLGYETVNHVAKDYAGEQTLIQISSLPSTRGREPFLRTDQLQVWVYSSGRTKTRNIAGEIEDHLHGHSFGTSHGLLDRVLTQTSPYEILIESDKTNIYSATYSVEVRQTP